VTAAAVRRPPAAVAAMVAAIVAAVVVLVGALSACSGVTLSAARLEQSIAPTFGRLYARQQVLQGNPRPHVADLRTRANCVKGAPSDEQQGAGNDWMCYVSYLADGAGTRVTASYVVDVKTDGCYAADGDGPTTLNGRRTVTGPGYRQVLNPLWLIDGCFDVG
jgi:ABC-2 type transport system permease protein